MSKTHLADQSGAFEEELTGGNDILFTAKYGFVMGSGKK